MAIKELYYIKPITYHQAIDIVIRHHYLHRKSSCMYSFGLFEKNSDELKGVVIYGKPASNQLCVGICGSEESKNVVELNRLFVFDDVPKNGESFLISNSMKLIDKEIIVSYADTQYGHLGIVYQATNWIYTGATKPRTDIATDGNKHSRHYDKDIDYSLNRKFRSSKHRYVYFNCNRKRKKELLHKLKYKVESYPKHIINNI